MFSEKPDYFIGVDVSKLTLSICVLHKNTINHFEISNNKSDIIAFFAMYANMRSYATFENTNTYNYDLMRAFDELGLAYARLDAFKFSHFLKHNSKNKTDKSDAYAIALYGSKFYEELGKNEFSEEFALIKSYQSGLTQLNKISTQIQNFNEALANIDNQTLKEAMFEVLETLKEQKKKVEDEVFELICSIVPQTKEIIKENKGFGKSFAVYVLPLIYLNKARSSNQLASYIGLAPMSYESGTSVKRGMHISGGAKLARNCLFMCSLTASKYNEHFSAIYKRLIKNGKGKKVALCAVARKMLVFVKNIYFKDDR